MPIASSSIGKMPIGGDAVAQLSNHAEVTIPMAVVFAQGHGISTAAVTIPSPVVAAFGGGSVQVVLTMPTVRARSGAGAAIVVPFPEVYGTAGPGLNIANITMPMMVVRALTGADATISVPMAVVAGIGTAVNWGQGVVKVPMAVAAGTGTVSAKGAGDIYIPMATVSSQAGAQGGAVIPMFTVAATGLSGTYGVGNITMPMMTVVGGGTAQGMGAGAVTIPMAVVSGGKGNVGAITIPMAQVVAFGGVVVAVNYEAYSVNLSHIGLGPRQIATDEVTRYTNFPFTDIVRLGDDYYGLGETGLMRLGGTADYNPAVPAEPLPVQWSWRTAISDFDSPMRKAPVSAYFAGRFAPDAALTLYVGETGSVSYAYTTPRGVGAQNYRQKFGRGLNARYYALGAEGDATLSLDTIDFDLNMLTRRI